MNKPTNIKFKYKGATITFSGIQQYSQSLRGKQIKTVWMDEIDCSYHFNGEWYQAKNFKELFLGQKYGPNYRQVICSKWLKRKLDRDLKNTLLKKKVMKI